MSWDDLPNSMVNSTCQAFGVARLLSETPFFLPSELLPLELWGFLVDYVTSHSHSKRKQILIKLRATFLINITGWQANLKRCFAPCMGINKTFFFLKH